MQYMNIQHQRASLYNMLAFTGVTSFAAVRNYDRVYEEAAGGRQPV